MNKIKIIVTLFILAFLLILAGISTAQQTGVYRDLDRDYKLGLELYNKEKYAVARRFFEKALISNPDAHTEIRSNSEYYAALCAVELFHKDADQKLTTFIQNYPQHPKANTAKYHLGNHNYRKKKFKDATYWYEQVDIYSLTPGELAEYYFKRGYAYFDSGKIEDAAKMFYEIKDTDNRYSAPATYYFSHISYEQKNYETAVNGFQKLHKDAAFGPIVPYYIAQIYFYQERYDAVIDYAPPLLDTASVKRAPEISRIIGESYFNLNKYSEALPYLEKYHKAAGRLTREDAYQLAFTYFQTGNFDKAAEFFEQAATKDDKLAQNAYYQLGKTYLKKDNKNFARNAFRQASNMNYNPDIREDALFSYAKLSYELANNPFNEAIDAFNLYLKEYPESGRRDEANKYLVNVFLTTKNYKEALAALDKIQNKSKELEYAHQKVAYYRGVDLFNAYLYDEAVAHFDRVISMPIDRNVTAQSMYWKAEALYNRKKFDEAAKTYTVYLREPGAAAMPEYFTAHYNQGYAFFKKKGYNDAISAFRRYTAVTPVEDEKKHNDALLRIADSYFLLQDYFNAADFYDRSAKAGLLNVDYALYQRGICLGLVGKRNEKIAALESVIKNNPNSFYAVDSKLEIGRTYLAMGDDENAMQAFRRIVAEHPKSLVVGKALVMQGVIHYNRNEDDEAVRFYKQVLRDYPGTPEANEALTGIKNISISSGRPELYADVIEKSPFSNVTRASLDSTHYVSAEGLYMRGDCEAAVKRFNDYLDKYPEGIFVLNVNFYRSECLYNAREYDKALEGYLVVNERPKNIFSEKSLAKTAAIQFRNKNYAEARNSYERLEGMSEFPALLQEARIGLMRVYNLMNNTEAAKAYADKISSAENLPGQVLQEAHLIQGKYLLSDKRYDEAFTKLKSVTDKAPGTSIAAEAKYNMAFVRFLQKRHQDSEKEIFDMGEKYSNFDYWVAKAYILLADNYLATNDSFQAKHTLQSIIDNYEGDDLKQIAQEKLNKILEAESPAPQRREPAKIEVSPQPEPQGGDFNLDDLFDEEEEDEREDF
jgi:TolA-binding protein